MRALALIKVVAAAAPVLLGGCYYSQGYYDAYGYGTPAYYAPVAPPQPIYEPIPAAPGPEIYWYWQPGYYDWGGGRYFWHRGEWGRRPDGYRHWEAPRWQHYDGHGWGFHRGHWR